jgi:hypothetical protein
LNKIRTKKGFILLEKNLLNEYSKYLFNKDYETRKIKINTNIQIRRLIQEHKINFKENLEIKKIILDILKKHKML